MCGIFGWIKSSQPLTPVEISQARKAVKLLRHRGPDSGGEWLDERVFMGHRRLKILDLSDRAGQPFHSADGRYVLSYNGEIYNYVELKQRLERDGHVFRTTSDTEVLLTAFVAWRESSFQRCDGMFALGLHEKDTGVHYLARDHFGQKPLYYFVHPDGLIYASELRAILALDGFNWQIDRQAFHRYVMFSYYPGADTPVVGIKKLLPGCVLRYDGRSTVIEPFWRNRPSPQGPQGNTERTIDELDELFDNACRITLRSDVPCGVFLSGGLDSSLIASRAVRHAPDLPCFSLAMEDRDFDESAKARHVVDSLGIRHHRVFTLSAGNAVEALAEHMQTMDEPHGDPGFLNATVLARAARPEITVALVGDGGDELFAGYPPFRALGAARFVQTLPAAICRFARAVAATMLPGSDTYLAAQFKALAFLQGFPAAAGVRYALWLSNLAPEEAARLCPVAGVGGFDPGGAPGTVFDCVKDLMADAGSLSDQQQLLYFYQKIFLPGFVCHHTDRATMQFGLESRSPFLSVPLAEYANRLEDSMRIRDGWTKWPLRQLALRDGLPKQIIEQRKRGFTFPVARLLKTRMRDAVSALAGEDLLGDDLVNRQELGRIIDDHLQGRRNHYRIIFALLVFVAWRRTYARLRVADI